MPYNHSIKAASPSGTAYTGRADGLFSLNEQVRFKSSGLWAIAIAAPSAPTITSVTVSGTQVSVAFTVSSLNGSTITGYIVTSSGGQTASGASSPIVVTGLTAGTSYTFTVVANSTNGNSIASATSSSYLITPTIGVAMQGGFYGGKINVSGTQYYLIVAPKASGEGGGIAWNPSTGTDSGITSAINGPTNSASLAALSSNYQVATVCEGLTIGGYSDWYLPAINELEVLYYFLKPSTTANITSVGSNANAVSPEPISTNHTSGSPAQTSAGIGFRAGETNAFNLYYYWSSTESSTFTAWFHDFIDGNQIANNKQFTGAYYRAVRRVAV
jgi:hypothetical protein